MMALIRLICLSLLLLAPVHAQTLAVPDATLPAPVTLPPRPLPDLSQLPDLIAAFDRAAETYRHFRTLDPPLDERVLALNLDPQAAFLMLRDEVASVQYDGHLRDPVSLFGAGGGNAYDKALALAVLLARMGYDTQLVTGTAPSPPPPATCGTGVIDPEAWRLTRLGPDVLTRLPLRAAASYAPLRPHLAPQDQPATPPTAPHVWVQMRDGADWVNLDPWLAGTAYGDAPAGPGTPLETAPPNHAIRLILTLETLSDGRLRHMDILNESFDVPAVSRAMLAMGFGPEIEGIGGGITAALSGLQGSGPRMVASLMLNGEVWKSRAFTAPGLRAGLEGFAEGGDDETTTALFLTVTSQVPGQPDHSETRAIFDLVPAPHRLSEAETLTQDTLLPVTMGKIYPAPLESLRQIVISNGGMSQRLSAALAVRQITEVPGLLSRNRDGLSDGWDMLQTTWIEASRIALAAETLLRARPPHDGACAVMDRPRVLIWGTASAGGDRVQQWLDWAIDGLGVQGGDATAQAELRLWHGALQAALETEALMWVTLSPEDSVPLDDAALLPLAQDLPEAAADRDRGYLTLADAGMPADLWWRVNPASGAADARGVMHGNTRWLEWGAERASAARTAATTSTSTVSEAEIAHVYSRSSAQLLAEVERDLAAAEAAAKQPRCGGNEYMILGTCVSIPASIATGVTVASAIAYALLG